MTLTRPPDWSEEGACIGLATRDRHPWSPGEHLTPQQQGFELHLARRICSACPDRVDCLVHELTQLPQHEPVSMRGGLTPDELVLLAKDLGVPHRRRTTRHPLSLRGGLPVRRLPQRPSGLRA